jgi:phosphopantetheinyl transferase (holo-ACP synthase)
MTGLLPPPVRGFTASRAIVIAVSAATSLATILDGRPVTEVFSPRERLHRARSIVSWAGRLAAKRAVLELLAPAGVGADALMAVEILPSPDGLCGRNVDRCTRPHRPQVRLAPPVAASLRPDERIDVSISHTDRVVVALAARTGAGHVE